VKGTLVFFSVDFGGGGGEDQFLFLAGGFENHLRAVDVGFDGFDGAFDDELDTNGCGEVDDDIGIINEFSEQLAILNAVQVIFQALGRLQMADVFHAAGGKIVEKHDSVAAIEQAFREMRADEAGAAGD